MNPYPRRSLCFAHPELRTATHQDEISNSSFHRLYQDSESLALTKLVELKTALRKASPDDFWQILCRGFAQIAQSQYCLAITRVCSDSKHLPEQMPATSDPGSGKCAVSYCYYDDGAEYRGYETKTNFQTFNCPCSSIRCNKRVSVHSCTSFPPSQCASDLMFACDAYLSIPLFTLDECVAHFCVMWSPEGLPRRTLSWGFLKLLLHSSEDIVTQHLVERSAELSFLNRFPAALERSAKKISHELRTPLQGIVGLSELMHAALHDASFTAVNPAVRETFLNLKEDIEAVQSSSRRAVDAADNVVQAYEMNILNPPVKTMAPPERQQDNTSNVMPRGTKRRLSESDLIGGNGQPIESKQRTIRCKVKEQEDASSPPCKISFPQPCLEKEGEGSGYNGLISSRHSPLFLRTATHGLQFTEVRRCIRDIVHECVKRDDHVDLIRPVGFDTGQQIEVQTKGSNGEVRSKTVTWDVDVLVPEFILVEQRDMAKMISCVLNNALKFTDEGRITLQIQCCPTRRSIRVTIKDTGPGISPDFRSEIFKPFTQQDDSASRCKEGLGLGLVVAKGLAKRLRGELNLVSTDVCDSNHGTEFEMRIPISPSADSSPTSLPNCPWDHSQGRQRSSTSNQHTHSHNINSGMPYGTEISPKSSVSFSSAEATNSTFVPAQHQYSQSTSSLATPFSDLDYYDYCSKRPVLPWGAPFEREPPPLSSNHFSQKFPAAEPSHPRLETDPLNESNKRYVDHNFAADHPLNFLVAEDNTVNRKLLVKMLAKLGYDTRTQIREACDGIEAVNQVIASASERLPGRRCSSAPPLSTNDDLDISMNPFDAPSPSPPPIDVILMDLWMPNMDGYEATEQILQICKTNKNGQGIYSQNAPLILAITADATQASMEKATKVGMGGLMLKPFGMSDLEQLVLDGWTKRQESSLENTDCVGGGGGGCRETLRRRSFIFGDDGPRLGLMQGVRA